MNSFPFNIPTPYSNVLGHQTSYSFRTPIRNFKWAIHSQAAFDGNQLTNMICLARGIRMGQPKTDRNPHALLTAMNSSFRKGTYPRVVGFRHLFFKPRKSNWAINTSTYCILEQSASIASKQRTIEHCTNCQFKCDVPAGEWSEYQYCEYHKMTNRALGRYGISNSMHNQTTYVANLKLSLFRFSQQPTNSNIAVVPFSKDGALD